ncbi:MAG: LPS assembly lipoprotein LptE [Verrucomicrobiota bacterium]|nr:LPS assembly lipoprotein LptE [Verrucomicrobiota bacterium]
MFLKLLIILIFVTTLLSSCSSYRLGNNKPVKYKDIESIAVPVVQSDVLKPKLQSLVTNAIIRSIQEKGAFKIAKEKNSDATLNIKIINIERKQLRASRENVLRTTEMEFIIEIEYRVLNNLNGVTIERGNVKAKSSSYLNPNFQLTENHSLRDAAEKLAISLANKLSEGY